MLLAADDALPKAETILDRFIEVTGGKAAYEKRKTEIATGTLELTAQGVKGCHHPLLGRPGQELFVARYRRRRARSNRAARRRVAWEKSAMTGPHLKSGEEKAQALREATFNAQLNWRKLYSKAETTGVETIDGEECYKVVLTPETGRPETTYYPEEVRTRGENDHDRW